MAFVNDVVILFWNKWKWDGDTRNKAFFFNLSFKIFFFVLLWISSIPFEREEKETECETCFIKWLKLREKELDFHWTENY